MSLKDLFLLPNLITLSRLFVSIYLFNQHSFSEFSTLNLVLRIAFIGISDSIDGIVARKFNLVTRLGTILDPVCDRIVFVLLLLWLLNIFPLWFFYGILIREVLVMLGSLYVLLNTKTLKVSNFCKCYVISFDDCFGLKLAISIPVRVCTWYPRSYSSEPKIV